MGRPKQHGEAAARALLECAEAIVEEEGLDALSVRRVAARAGVTTRAVYGTFGSKDALIAALGGHAFDLLGAAVAALPMTGDPVSDLVEAGLAFRRFALDHPPLFTIAVQRTAVPDELAAAFRPSAAAALAHLERRVAAVAAATPFGVVSVHERSRQFHALCEGLAAVESRGVLAGEPDKEQFWRDALGALVLGFTVQPNRRRR